MLLCGQFNILKGLSLATQQELSNFLAGVERRAYKQAVFAVRNDHAALDIVQDAMIKLTVKYAEKPLEEWPMLFQTILQNTIRDYHRRQKIRSFWTPLFSSFTPSHEENESDLLETLAGEDGTNFGGNPSDQLEKSQIVALIEEAVANLPARQREAFLLRYWEEMDVAETAAIMGCSEGSVKTHCFRATEALAAVLKKKGVEP